MVVVEEPTVEVVVLIWTTKTLEALQLVVKVPVVL